MVSSQLNLILTTKTVVKTQSQNHENKKPQMMKIAQTRKLGDHEKNRVYSKYNIMVYGPGPWAMARDTAFIRFMMSAL